MAGDHPRNTGPNAGELALWGQDSVRPAVSRTSREWKTALPDARRRARVGCTPWQPECPQDWASYARIPRGVASDYEIHPGYTIPN